MNSYYHSYFRFLDKSFHLSSINMLSILMCNIFSPCVNIRVHYIIRVLTFCQLSWLCARAKTSVCCQLMGASLIHVVNICLLSRKYMYMYNNITRFTVTVFPRLLTVCLVHAVEMWTLAVFCPLNSTVFSHACRSRVKNSIPYVDTLSSS